jgi:hypothetical protein
MAYFKINTSGCGERNGLVRVRYDCYLSRDDAGNEEHYITEPDFTAAKYEGKVDEEGVPVDVDDYREWIKSLPTITRNNPFCCHFVQFEYDVSNEVIVTTGESVLKMALENFQKNALHENCNLPLELSKVPNSSIAESRIEQIKQTDFAALETAVEENCRIRS